MIHVWSSLPLTITLYGRPKNKINNKITRRRRRGEEEEEREEVFEKRVLVPREEETY